MKNPRSSRPRCTWLEAKRPKAGSRRRERMRIIRKPAFRRLPCVYHRRPSPSAERRFNAVVDTAFFRVVPQHRLAVWTALRKTHPVAHETPCEFVRETV